MNEAAGHFPGMLVSADEPIEREFEDAVRTSADLAVRVAFSILRRRDDAEEITQEAYARAYLRFRDLREPQPFRAWIVRVTWRLAVDRWRADRRRLAREQATAESIPGIDAEEEAVRAERSAVLILAALQGHDIREVAQLLEIPEGTDEQTTQYTSATDPVTGELMKIDVTLKVMK